MKEVKTTRKFICDECEKQSKEDLEDVVYPYHLGWRYLYCLDFKVCKKQELVKDKHFCSTKCMVKFITRKILEAEKEQSKIKKLGDENEKNRL